MQSVGAAWLMTSLTRNPLYIALIQTASALPFFLLALSAGSIGDIFDRRRLILGTETWMFGVAVVLAAAFSGSDDTLAFAPVDFGALHRRRCRIANVGSNLPGAGQQRGVACRAFGSEWDRIQSGPCSRAFGLGGFVVAAVGVGAAFAFNAFSFLGVIAVIARWKRPARKSILPVETFGGATSAAIRYVRYSPGIRRLLLRSAVLIFFTSSFWALLPTAARELSKSPIAYGFLLGFFGLGAVLGAVVLQRTRSKLSTEALLAVATAVFAAIILSLALLRSPAILCFLMLFGGASWTALMSLFNITVQELAPDWVRARVLAVYLFVFQGSVALGSTLWGYVALHANVHRALVFASIGTGACLLLGPLFRLPNTNVDLSIWNHWAKPAMMQEPAPDQGPVLVTVRYVIDPAKAAEFLHQIHKYERVRRRDGATSWGIFFDTEAPDTYLESFKVDSWAEHERQHGRFTVADSEIEKRVVRYALKPIEVKHYIYAREKLQRE